MHVSGNTYLNLGGLDRKSDEMLLIKEHQDFEDIDKPIRACGDQPNTMTTKMSYDASTEARPIDASTVLFRP